jgi:hypothetical protein
MDGMDGNQTKAFAMVSVICVFSYTYRDQQPSYAVETTAGF